MKVIISGGSGLIGRALTSELVAAGQEVFILSRRPDRVQDLPEGALALGWDGRTSHGWGPLVDGETALVNLAGENVGGGRWTAARKRRIEESRMDAGRALVEAIGKARVKPRVLLQSSAVGIYGSRGDESLTETSAAGDDFLARVCLAWEASTASVAADGLRHVVLRTGVVFSRDGGALPKLLLPFRFRVGGRLGSGRQWVPWIHLQDEVGAICHLLESDSAQGSYNLASPQPVTNLQLTEELSRQLRRPAWMPAPAFALRLLLGEMAEMVLGSQRAVPARLQEAGFTFRYPHLAGALEDLLAS